MKNVNRVLVIMVSTFFMTSCFFDGNSVDANTTIKEAPVSRFIYPNTEVFLEDSREEVIDAPQALLKQKDPIEVGLNIILSAQLKAVDVDGLITQASDVIKWGSYALVAYNTAGDEYRGALQWISDFQKDINHPNKVPTIDREIHLSDIDVNVIYISGNTLYVGGAADPVKYGGASYISWMDAKSGQASDLIKNQKIFGSFGVTGIEEKQSSIFITTGAQDGELIELDNKTLDSIKAWPRSDLRSIVKQGDDLYVLAGTTDGSELESGIYKHDVSKSKFEEIHSFASFGSDYHRAEISVLDNKLIIGALGQAGFKIWDADNSFSEEWSYTLPTLSPYKISANGFETDSKFLFMAMGEWGVEIHELPDVKNDFKNSVSLGRINFAGETDGDGQNFSANHLVYETNRLLVASGSGGLMIYDLEEL